MAEASQWNRPKSAGGDAQGTRHKSQSTSYANRKGRPFARGLLAALVVVIGGVLAFYFICGQSETPASSAPKEKKRGKIAEVEPVKVVKKAAKPDETTQQVASNKKSKKPKHDYRYDVVPGAYRDERGILRTPTGRRILEDPPARTIKLFDDNQKKIFKNHAENEICRLLTMRPGSFVLPSYYGPSFERSLRECIDTPVTISPDDSPDVVEKKKAVQEAKEFLKERMAAGESPSDIMRQTLNEYRQLEVYRKDLIKTVMDFATEDGATDQDVEDYAAAANAILAERGMQPIQSKALHKYRVKMLKESGANE